MAITNLEELLGAVENAEEADCCEWKPMFIDALGEVLVATFDDAYTDAMGDWFSDQIGYYLVVVAPNTLAAYRAYYVPIDDYIQMHDAWWREWDEYKKSGGNKFIPEVYPTVAEVPNGHIGEYLTRKADKMHPCSLNKIEL